MLIRPNFWCGLFLVFLCGCASTPRVPTKPQVPAPVVATAGDYLKRGRDKFYHSEYAQALVDLENAARLAPNDPEVLSARAMAKSALKDFQGAYADFQAALRLVPRLADIYYHRGLALRRAGDFYGSLQDFNSALALEPSHGNALNSRGNSYAALKEFSAALADYTRAIELSPRFGNAFMNRGTTHLRMGNYSEALLDLNIAVGLRVSMPAAIYNRGVLFRATNEYSRAEADFLLAKNIKPEFGAAYAGLGGIAMHYGNFEQACAEMDRAMEREPNRPSYYLTRGLINEALNRDAEAASDYQMATELEQDPIFPEIQFYARLHWNLLLRRTANADPKIHLSSFQDSDSNWPGPIADYLVGRRSAVAILQEAKKRRWPPEQREAECEALYFIGMNEMLAGRTSDAVRYFERCLATGMESVREYPFAKLRRESLVAAKGR